MLVSENLIRAGETLMAAMAFAKEQRRRVDEIVRGILAEREYLIADEFRRYYDRRKSLRVLEPKDTFLIASEERETLLYPEITRRQEAAGLFPQKPGCCPALEAESLQTQAENAFLLLLGSVMGQGNIFLRAYGKNREAALHLGLSLVAPFVGTSEQVLNRLGASQAA